MKLIMTICQLLKKIKLRPLPITKPSLKKIIAFIEDNKFELVETFAEKIAEMVITDFDVNWIRLRVSKPGALRFSKDVGVIIERTASDYE